MKFQLSRLNVSLLASSEEHKATEFLTPFEAASVVWRNRTDPREGSSKMTGVEHSSRPISQRRVEILSHAQLIHRTVIDEDERCTSDVGHPPPTCVVGLLSPQSTIDPLDSVLTSVGCCKDMTVGR